MLWHTRERVVPVGAVWIAHIPIDVLAVQPLRQRSCSVAMRIDQTEAVALSRILQRELLEQGRFPGAGLPEQEQVVETIVKPDAERAFAIAIIGKANSGNGLGVCELDGHGTILARCSDLQ